MGEWLNESLDVAPIHPDVTLVLLPKQDGGWMNASWEIAREPWKPPRAKSLEVLRRDAKEDRPVREYVVE